MLGTRIVLDEEKIIKDGIYKLDELYAYLDEVAKEACMIKQDKFTYLCKGDENDLFNLGNFTMYNVIQNEAITKNVKEWFWLENGEIESNIISESKQDGIGKWN